MLVNSSAEQASPPALTMASPSNRVMSPRCRCSCVVSVIWYTSGCGLVDLAVAGLSPVPPKSPLLPSPEMLLLAETLPDTPIGAMTLRAVQSSIPVRSHGSMSSLYMA